MDGGEIVESEPPRRLVIRWQNQFKPELKAEGESQCTMELEPSGTAVKLSITHSIEREPSKFIVAVSGGWPKVISNLKSLLETGSAVLQDPYPIESAPTLERNKFVDEPLQRVQPGLDLAASSGDSLTST